MGAVSDRVESGIRARLQSELGTRSVQGFRIVLVKIKLFIKDLSTQKHAIKTILKCSKANQLMSTGKYDHYNNSVTVT